MSPKPKSSRTNRLVLMFTIAFSILAFIIAIACLLVYLIDQRYIAGLTTNSHNISNAKEVICTPLSCEQRCLDEWYEGNFTCELGSNVGPVDYRQQRPTKVNHKAKLLSTKKLQSVAGLSDIDRMYMVELDPLLIERVSGTEGNRRAGQHIINRLTELRWTIELDEFEDNTPYGTKQFKNIIATYTPSVQRKLVLACHYDSKYYAPRQDGRVFMGATDSAVPCAMLLDMAYSLQQILRDGSNEIVTLQFIFFDGEEAFRSWTDTDSLYGSRHLAAKWQQNGKLNDMDMLVLLDLIGVANPSFQNHFPAQTGKWFEHMQRIETRLHSGNLLQNHNSANMYFVNRASSGGIQDDHIPFLRKDVACFHMIAYPFPKVWHNMNDNKAALDRDTIDNLNKMLQVFTIEYLHLRVTQLPQ